MSPASTIMNTIDETTPSIQLNNAAPWLDHEMNPQAAKMVPSRTRMIASTVNGQMNSVRSMDEKSRSWIARRTSAGP